jgi:MtN3 and saliva related transmembrane protein
MEATTAIGLVAGTLTTASFLPQVIKTWRSKSAADLSFAMLLIFLGGIALWMWYGISIQSWPIILANAATIVLVVFIIAMKWSYGRSS